MAALSASQDVRTRGAHQASVQVEDAEIVYAGGFAALWDERNATAAKKGRLAAFQAAAGQILMGRVHSPGSQTGDVDASPVPEAQVSLESEVLENVPVAGVTAVLDQGKVVWISTDNLKADLTLTRPTRAQPLGIVVRFRATGYADVLILGLASRLALMGAGRKEIVRLGSFDNADLATGNVATGFPMAFSGKILSVFGMVEKAFTGSGGTADVNLEIDATNVTGGVVTVSTAAGGTIGAKLDGTPVTAANYFQEGSVIDVEVANTGGTQTAGRVAIYMVVERMPGL